MNVTDACICVRDEELMHHAPRNTCKRIHSPNQHHSPRNSGPSKVLLMAVAAVVASAVNLAIPLSDTMLIFLALCFLQGIGLSVISTLGNIVL